MGWREEYERQSNDGKKDAAPEGELTGAATGDYERGRSSPQYSNGVGGEQAPKNLRTFTLDDEGIPFFITQAQKARLRELGHTDEQIAKMRPAEAQAILANGASSPKPSVFTWKMHLYDRATLACERTIKASPEGRAHLAAMTEEDYVATVQALRNVETEPFSADPSDLTVTELEEEIGAVARALLKKYGPKESPSQAKKAKIKGLLRVDEYLADYGSRAARPFLWEEMLYQGTFNMLLGRPFSGKSSIAAALLRAITLGMPLLRRRCRQAKCAYLALERNGASVATMLEAWGLADKVWFADEIPIQDAAAYIESQIRDLKLEFVVIDHLQHAARILQGNQYTEVSDALAPYQRIARETGCCILALHHQKKPQPKQKDEAETDDEPIEALGSEAYRAASDTLLEATTNRDEYFLRGQPRAGSDLARTNITIDFETGEVTGRDAEQGDLEAAASRIVEFLFRAGTAVFEKDIRKGVEGRTRIITTALRTAVSEGRVKRDGQGGVKDPFRYSLVEQ